MAKFDMNVGLDDFMKDLSSVDVDIFAPEAIESASPIVEQKLKQKSEPHKVTGAMVKSIKPSKVKRQKDGSYSLIVRPTGKDKKGVRNMEKMAYLEYGVLEHNQPATPVITPTVRETEDKVLAHIQKSFDDYLTKKGL